MALVRSGFIAIPPGARPGFDHADTYRDGTGAARLYVSHTGADRVDVIDCAANSYLRALDGHPGVAGVLIDTETDLLFTSDRTTPPRLNGPTRRHVMRYHLPRRAAADTASTSPPHPARPVTEPSQPGPPRFGAFPRYFLGLGTWGFGGPIASVGYMQRDLVLESSR